MTAKTRPTETRVRAALLRLWQEFTGRAVNEHWTWTARSVLDEMRQAGADRNTSIEAVQRAGLRMAKAGCVALSDDAEATYERGVFRVRKRRTAEDAAESGECVIVHGCADLDSPIHLPDAEPRVTQRQLDMMRVATGGALHDTRNFYVTGPENRDWCELVEMGLAERGYVNERGGLASTTFSVTEAGFRMTYGDVRKPRKGAKR